MAEVSFTGGARIGWVNASYPFAKLSCSRERLMLASLGTYEFTPDQVVSFGTYGSIPLLANGLRINHNRLDYPEKVVFWCAGSRDKVLREVGRMGFAPRGQPITRPKGFAFKWTVVIAFVVIWNLRQPGERAARRAGRDCRTACSKATGRAIRCWPNG